MVRRGFTLIEMLAVIAILLVVMAISLPAIEGRLAGARFEAAAQRVDSGLSWARAESQRRGEALRVEVRAIKDGTGLFLEPLQRSEESAGNRAASEGTSAAAEPQPFAVLEAGLALSDRAPQQQGKGADGSARPVSLTDPKVGGPAAALSGADAIQPLMIATFLPDGSAMAAGQVYLTGFERAASLTVNHWTGGVRIVMLDLTAPAKNSVDDSGAGGAPGGSGPTGGAGSKERQP